ncbi:LolA family protein [Litoreibacter roseus]|uniref:Outer-membrane lipoprotein carrier protein n=1 Tax=Litoreibacter roseus TaxID=2601869 RepID=A0A6N6JJP0_9RHOB|nr:outer membrane lipoprotein carrier protein LolA [Litoreibacter roseus]GFE66275.1 outer-membrane lipoprotein carrier protein [Litoreibacter roseus]
MRHLLLTPIVVLALAAPAIADRIPLSKISNYMNAMTSATGEFTQINSDGTVTTGDIFIRRPGRVRFEYAPPDRSLVIAGGGQVAVFDPKSNVPPEQFPLSRTPLNLILAERVNLNRSNMVVGHGQDGNATTVTVQDPANPEYGNIQLKFTDNPVELRQWVITNDTGAQTTVILGDLNTGARIGAGKFSIPQEITRRGF